MVAQGTHRAPVHYWTKCVKRFSTLGTRRKGTQSSSVPPMMNVGFGRLRWGRAEGATTGVGAEAEVEATAVGGVDPCVVPAGVLLLLLLPLLPLSPLLLLLLPLLLSPLAAAAVVMPVVVVPVVVVVLMLLELKQPEGVSDRHP